MDSKERKGNCIEKGTVSKKLIWNLTLKLKKFKKPNILFFSTVFNSQRHTVNVSWISYAQNFFLFVFKKILNCSGFIPLK